MGVFSSLKSLFILLFAYVVLTSGLIVNFLMLLTVIFIWPFNKDLYRKVNHYLAYSLWCQFTFLAQWWSGSDFHIYMTREDLDKVTNEHCITILNHKYELDWLVGWLLIQRLGILGGCKIIGKMALKYVPIFGWAWICTESIFLRRKFDADKVHMPRDVRVYGSYPPNFYVNIVFLCEGTRFTEVKRLESMKVAKSKGLPELKHHLLPRTKGFNLLMESGRGSIASIYDGTIGFRRDYAEPTLLNLLRGKKCVADVYCRRIPLTDVPEDEEKCAAWVHKLYQEKDRFYDQFDKTGRFEGLPEQDLRRNYKDLVIEVFWMILLVTPLVFYVGRIVIFGSIYVQLTFVIICALTSIVARKMIAVTEIEKDSSSAKYKNE